uniref:Major facilitator superfamily (MFS) profile domain-containing protein n=1 Tax=Globodera rostochiensis TaxID=31243 RepID=A0A914H222_GLORO
MIVLCCVFIVGNLCSSLAPNFAMLLPARVLLGLSLGGFSSVVPIILSELSPSPVRAQMVTRNTLNIVGGQLLAFVVGAVLGSVWEERLDIWRWMNALSLLPACVLLLGTVLFVPESPRWLISRGQEKQAFLVLCRVRSNAAEAREELAEIEQNQTECNRGERLTFRKVLVERWLCKCVLIGLGIALSQQIVGVAAPMYYGTNILERSGMDTELAMIVNVSIGIVSVTSMAFGLWMIGHTDRRPMLLVGMVGSSLSHLMIALSSWLMPNGNAKGTVILLLLLLFCAFMQSSITSVTWFMLAEIFPLQIRGTTIGICSVVVWMTKFTQGLLLPVAMDFLGIPSTFLLLLLFTALSTAFVWLFLPETRGACVVQQNQNKMPTGEYEKSMGGNNKKQQPREEEGSILSKFGTLTKRKKSVPPADASAEEPERKDEDEAELVEKLGKDAIDSCLILPQPDLRNLEDGQSLRTLTIESRDDTKVQEICQLLLCWLNDELAEERIVVRNLQEDIYDGQVIQKLVEKLAQVKIEVPEVSQSEEGQKQKWRIIVDALNRTLHEAGGGSSINQPGGQPKWTAEMIHAKDIVAILHLLVTLALHYRAPIRFPNNVNVQVLIYTRHGKQISKSIVTEQLTTKQTELAPKGERDAFDTLFDYGPDKLQHVKNSLVAFCNKHLNKINLEVTDLETQFQDGVFLILLMGLLEGYFVPLYKFHLQVNNNEEKLKNVQFAYFLMDEAGMPKPKCRPADIVNGDLKSTLRVLHALFTKYKLV